MICRLMLVLQLCAASVVLVAAPPAKEKADKSAEAGKDLKAKSGTEPVDDDPLNKATLYQDPPYVEPTKSERDEACRKYNGKNITYYQDVYSVRDCKLFRIDDVYTATKKGIPLTEVDSRTVDVLRYEGKVIADTRPALTCAQLEGKYVTISFVEVFWVEKCKKRLFPDWASFENHRGKLESNRNVVWVTGDEIAGIANGEPMPSVLNAESKALLQADGPIEVIPLEEACRGLIGKYVSYLDEIFFIQNITGPNYTSQHCQKRKVDSEEFTARSVNTRFKLSELTSTQAISIPTGKPVESQKPKEKPTPDRS